MKTVMPPTQDAVLVADCLQGNREAFGVLVEQYQSLICTLIYCRCGSVAQSEDLAQETFLAAWKSLPSLKEPTQFKAWLCQIARNISADAARQQERKAHGNSVSIEVAPELIDDRPSPAAQAIRREDESLVWRTLEQLPENYRLPLVLFHREEQSVAQVAAVLDLSEDVVRQRLSRGREMLREGVNDAIEGVLGRTKPGKKFTAAVMVAIGAVGTSTAKAAGAGIVAASNTIAAAKAASGAGTLIGLGVVPLIGDWVLWRLLPTKARSADERAILNKCVMVITLSDVLFTLWMFIAIHLAPHFSQMTVIATVIGSAVGFLVLRWLQIYVAFRKTGWIGGGRKAWKGYAPGWQVRCPACGLTVDAGAAGLVRIGAVGTTRRLGPCGRCERWRWLIVERAST